MKVVYAVITAVMLLVPDSVALEPADAFEDGFTAHAPATGAAALYAYPGTEALTGGVTAGVGWREPFGMNELAVTTVAVGAGFGRGFGVSAAYTGTGFDLYGEDQEKVGVAWAPLPWIGAGVRAVRTAMRIDGFVNASVWSVDAGMVARPVDTLVLSCAVENAGDAELGASKEPLDGKTRAGVTWLPSDDTSLFVAVADTRRYRASATAGALAGLYDILTVGVCGSNNPGRISFLCGVTVMSTVFSYRSEYHRELGMTHGFTISRFP